MKHLKDSIVRSKSTRFYAFKYGRLKRDRLQYLNIIANKHKSISFFHYNNLRKNYVFVKNYKTDNFKSAILVMPKKKNLNQNWLCNI